MNLNHPEKRYFHHHGHVGKDMRTFTVKYTLRWDDIEDIFECREVISSNTTNAWNVHGQLLNPELMIKMKEIGK